MNADRKAIEKKLFLQPLDWLTLMPFLAGSTLGLGAWAIDKNSGMISAASLILIFLSVGIYLHRLLLGWNQNYEQAAREWLNNAEKKRDDELDCLYRDLTQDGDPRTEALLKDLRTLTKALTSEQSGSSVMSSFDIVSDVNKLFQRSVDYLQESLELWRMSEQVESDSIKTQLLEQREALVHEVEKSLQDLGEVLASMKKASVSSADGGQLAELREDLATRLRIAEEVEKKMQGMRSQRSADDEEKYLKFAEK